MQLTINGYACAMCNVHCTFTQLRRLSLVNAVHLMNGDKDEKALSNFYLLSLMSSRWLSIDMFNKCIDGKPESSAFRICANRIDELVRYVSLLIIIICTCFQLQLNRFNSINVYRYIVAHLMRIDVNESNFDPLAKQQFAWEIEQIVLRTKVIIQLNSTPWSQTNIVHVYEFQSFIICFFSVHSLLNEMKKSKHRE